MPFRRLACAALWCTLIALVPSPAAGQVPQLSADQRRALDSLASFLRKFGQPGEADTVMAAFSSGRIRVGPVPDNDNADTDVDTHVITLNSRMAEQILRPEIEGWRFTADWAATLRHELVHTTQGPAEVVASNVRHAAGGDQPHEVSAWRAGFQSTYDWMQAVRARLSHTSSESARDELARQLRALAQNFIVYEQNFAPHRMGRMTLTDADQLPLALSDALAEANRLVKESNAMLARADFRIRVAPPKLTVKAGVPFAVSANRFGGAYGDPTKANTNDNAFSYVWTVNGKRVGTGRALTRTITKGETLTIEVHDKLGAKRFAICVVTVTPAEATSARQPAAPGKAASAAFRIHPSRLTMETGGQLVAFQTPGLTERVQWSVQSTSDGTIDVDGLYRVPTKPGTYLVRAALARDPTVTATAVITVMAPNLSGVHRSSRLTFGLGEYIRVKYETHYADWPADTVVPGPRFDSDEWAPIVWAGNSFTMRMTRQDQHRVYSADVSGEVDMAGARLARLSVAVTVLSLQTDERATGRQEYEHRMSATVQNVPLTYHGTGLSPEEKMWEFRADDLTAFLTVFSLSQHHAYQSQDSYSFVRWEGGRIPLYAILRVRRR